MEATRHSNRVLAAVIFAASMVLVAVLSPFLWLIGRMAPANRERDADCDPDTDADT